MGLFGRLWRRPEKRELSLDKFRGLGLLDPPNAAGVVVNERTALTFSAYFNGVDLISGQVAGLPRKVYRKAAENDREEAGANHPAQWLIHDEPNEYMTPFVFWQTLMGHVLTWGNGYAAIEWDGAMRPLSLVIVTPDRVEVKMIGRELQYVVDGGRSVLNAEDVFHIPGLAFDGLRGYSVATMARQSLALGLAAERFGASFFGQGAWPGVVAHHPATLSQEASDRLRKSWNDLHQGPDKAHRLAIFEEGMKIEKIGIPPEDAQFLQSREFQVVEVARWLNLPPHKLKHKVGERPGGNIEASQIEFLTDTLAPWLTRIEQECNRKLLSKTQRGTYYVQHVVNAVLRTDAQTRMEVQKGYLDMGVMTQEQIAQQENLPKPKPKAAPAASPPPPAGPDPVARAWRRVAVDVLARMTKLEADRARRAATQGPEKFQAWADEFYAGHEVRLREALEPVVRGWYETRGLEGWAERLSAVVADIVRESRDELLAARAAALEADVEGRVSRWERERPSEAAEKIMEAA